jgi:alkylation response protein AidB-like acyl-CoA dehydrogenase
MVAEQIVQRADQLRAQQTYWEGVRRQANAALEEHAEKSQQEAGVNRAQYTDNEQEQFRAQMAGAMRHMQVMTLEYAMTRKQFGREIGTFQAVQHHLAVMAEQVLSAQMAAQAALIGPPLEICGRRAAVAKCRAGEAAQQVSAIAHAVHGAIGISREHHLHHYVRRLREWRLACGGDSWWAAKLGDWVLAQPADVASLIQGL